MHAQDKTRASYLDKGTEIQRRSMRKPFAVLNLRKDLRKACSFTLVLAFVVGSLIIFSAYITDVTWFDGVPSACSVDRMSLSKSITFFSLNLSSFKNVVFFCFFISPPLIRKHSHAFVNSTGQDHAVSVEAA